VKPFPSAEPVVPLPPDATVATSPPVVEPLPTEPAGDKALPALAPVAKTRETIAGRQIQPMHKMREEPTKRDHVARGTPPRLASSDMVRGRLRAPRFRVATRGRARVHRAAAVRSPNVRGFGARMNATRYRVGRTMGCFVRFRCTRRQIAGAVIGAAAGGAVGRGGGAVAGALIGAVVGSPGR
jgi:hypothetical protein